MNYLQYKNELEKINSLLVNECPFHNSEEQDKILKEILTNKVKILKISRMSVSEAEQEVEFQIETIQSKL